ncbi:MAG: hypothetical protein KF791_03255 [Verrucomicrobiae bacterium]|nr:hypothetical protein [Verrucomicrobiae bacterium]
MDWQEPAALAVVAATLLTLGWRWMRARRPGFHRRTGCGCDSVGTRPPGVLVSGRRGEAPRILVTGR